MKKSICLFSLLALLLTGCQGALLTAIYLVKGNDVPPQHDILLKGEKRVAVVPRSVYSNSFEVQNAPREIAKMVNSLLVANVQEKHNKKLRVVEQPKVETWLDHCNNDFDTFAEVGRDKSIKADIVIGFDIIEFRIRDPKNASLIQGHCQVEVRAIDCETGRVLAAETLQIIDPPQMPLPNNPRLEPQFRALFTALVAQKIAALFHHHDPHKLQRMEADNLEMHRIQ